MGRRLNIQIGQLSAQAELNDSDCAREIHSALPIEALANTWGQEVYFSIGVDCPLSDQARDNMQVGELAYWPTGRAFCIFFGRTPASGPDGRPRAASEVDPIGKVLGDASVFGQVRDGQKVVLSAAT